MIESLESRRLWSTTWEGGVLSVYGTTGDDHIEAYQTNTHLVLSDNGATSHHKLATLKRIVVWGRDGADTIILSNKSVTIPARLEGGRGPDTLSAGKGNDTITAGGADDYLFGGDGNDLLDGNSEADDFLGGNGRDTASYLSRTAAVSVGLGTFPDDGEVGEGDNVRADIEVVWGGSGNDAITTTSGRAVRFFGFAGNDTLTGSLGGDLLDGGSGNDSLEGNGGADTLLANDGVADTVNGGSGTDIAESDALDTVQGVP